MVREKISPEDQALAAAARTIERLGARPQTYLTDEGKERVETLRLKFRRGALTAEELGEELLKLGMPKSQVDAILDNEIERKEAAAKTPKRGK